MSWMEATYTNRSGKRQQVWVRTDGQGEFVIEDGRVPMRYSDTEEARLYSAHPRNVAIGTDGAAPEAKKKSPPKKRASYSEDVWKAPDGDRVISRDIPHGLEAEAVPAAGVIDVWTDGACTGNPGPCGFGVILRTADSYTEIGQYIGTGTNNIAELMAIGVALEELRDIDGRVRIHTDSNYSIGVLSKGWKAKANVELIAWIRELVAERPIKFVKVKGHAGIPLNERADQLAVAAVERRG